MHTYVITVNLNNNIDHPAQMEEFLMLAKGAGAQIVGHMDVKRDKPDAAHFIGSGKVEEIRMELIALDCDLVLIDQPLTPAQQRNLERVFNVRVIDRVALILDIFALRAKSHEGKLQVELAQLQRLVTRLTRMWTHLERQRGGIGLRGPGESQLEVDKRLIGGRIKALKERLQKVEKQRKTQRRARKRGHVPTISLVGYTNAGKSTLFNALAHEKTYAADQLFATLDTTSRRVWLPELGNVVISDTVGFIRDLPTTLIAAFKATLEETCDADLLLHVVDAGSPQRDEQILAVNQVLEEIQAQDIPVILVYNKIDSCDLPPKVVKTQEGQIRVYTSALTSQGLPLLREQIAEFFKSQEGYAFETYQVHYEE